MKSTHTVIKPSLVEVNKLITQSAFAKRQKISRQRVQYLIRTKELNTIDILGTTLILLDS